MTNTEKTRILKGMRKLAETGQYAGLCAVLEMVNRNEGLALTLSDLGITHPLHGRSDYWFPKYEIAPRLKLIDEALAKCETKFKVGDRVECIKGTPIHYSVGEKATVCHTDNSQDVNIRIKKDNGKETWAYGSDFKLITSDPIKEAEQRVKDAQAELERLRNTPKDVEGLYKGQNMYWHNTVFPKQHIEIADQKFYSAEAYLSPERAEKELLRIRLAFIADSLNGGLFEPKKGETPYSLCYNNREGIIVVANMFSSYGHIYFKTKALAEEAMTYFSKDELIKMLS